MGAHFDPDHALAILLQARFNQEEKNEKKNGKENSPVSAIKKSYVSPRASLVDPEWEVTDPCPDIHGLFIAFNARFFWGRLQGVEVRWSPQMTSCAGICVYEGRQGLCSVRLSAPLLKLRPRSDLIETLLHEMIHAYLFVTHNNRDREGHGPEFHKHMWRINREAGTNITVYHSFHAEVKVYQQHWWRCNGPCQRRPPFFGMVKRAKNRVPGPNDLWWADHQALCGGQFIKVREPENYKNKTKGKKGETGTKGLSKSGNDIRNFFKKPSPVNSSHSKTVTSGQMGNNIHGFHSPIANGSEKGPAKPLQGVTTVNRVVGFKDLSSSNNGTIQAKGKPLSTFGGQGNVLGQGSNKTSGSNTGRGFGRGGMLANWGGGTLVVSGSQGQTKPVEKQDRPNTKLIEHNFKPFSGSGFSLGGPSQLKDRSRSRLLSIGHEPEEKRMKTDQDQRRKSDGFKKQDNKETELKNCPVCNEKFLKEEMDLHFESCCGLQNVFNDCTSSDPSDDPEISKINDKYKIVSCPVCALNFEGDINTHLDECLNMSGILNVFDEPPIELSDSDNSPVKCLNDDVPKPKLNISDEVQFIEPEESEARVACPLCGMRFGESRINGHVNQCIDDMDDDL